MNLNFLKRKPAQKKKRGFKAAGVGRLTWGWATAPTTTDYDIRAGLSVLRARARESYQNNEYVKHFVRLAQTNVIGHRGIILQSRVQMADGKPDSRACAAIESAFSLWGKRGSADLSNRKSWWQIQRDFIQSVCIDGEFLAVEVPAKPYGYRLLVLDPERLSISFDDDRSNGNKIRSSIEYDVNGTPVAYWIRDPIDSPHQSAYTSAGPENHTRYPADRVIHEFLPEFAIQGRGVPLVTVGMYRLGMLDGYQEAEVVGARIAAASMMLFEQTSESDGEGFTGDYADESNPGDFELEIEPGVGRTLPVGLKPTAWSPNRPSQVYEGFVRNCLQQFASGLGVSYAGLANDYSGANYSSLRQALLLERDLWKDLQTWVSESLHDRVFDNWLMAALAFGKITINGQEPRRNHESYRPREWQGRRWQWVDPQKELAAIEKGLSLKVQSPQQVIREMGRDPDAVLDEWAEWQKKLDERGLKPADMVPALQNITEGEDDAEEDEVGND